MNFLFGTTSLLSKLSEIADKLQHGEYEGVGQGYAFLAPLIKLIDGFMLPLLIVVLAAGTIYAVILGVNMARADSSEARDAAKKRLINVIVGFGIIIVLLVAIYAIATFLPEIIGLTEQTAVK